MLEFVLTATDDFFFFGTRQSYDAVVAGDTLAMDGDFAKSTQYFLPDATNVWYANADGLITSTAAPLAVLGPAIGNVFNNIVMELDGGSSSDDDMSQPSMLDMIGDPTVINEILESFQSMLGGMTITTSIDETGLVRFRATMTVNP